jgi:Sulfate permease and related transporters (MFS superfamily)
MFSPKLFTCLKTYSKDQFISDCIAGVIVGVVAIPLAIAFAIASGVSPDKGLVTAIIAGFLVSVLGGSRVQIGGPTGAFVVIVYGIVQKYGIDGLVIATMIAGILLILMGAGQARHGGEIHSAFGDRRVHQRHCRDHLFVAGKRFFRIADCLRSRGIRREMAGVWRTYPYGQL